jgi:Zn-finger nucleic acid-binding protein
MKCPVCKSNSLKEQELVEGLQSWHCLTCQGNWLKSFQFWNWIETKKETLSIPVENVQLELQDNTDAKVCIECSHILRKFKVSHDLDFYIDRCMTCGGIWFDRNEWQAMSQKGLQKQIHLIFSANWQHQIKEAEYKSSLKELYREKLKGDFDEVIRVKEWLKSHPQKVDIYAFLNLDL